MDRVHQVAHGNSLNRLAFSATVHCLTGCSIGEVMGMVIGTALNLGTASTIALSIVLAFASDTVSITIMEIVDNAVMLVIPGAMDAGLAEFRFWGSLASSLLIAGDSDSSHH
jgi:hypothetical protein